MKILGDVLVDLRYETLRLPYFSDLSSNYHHFLKTSGHFFPSKIFLSKEEVKIIFKDFLVSKPLVLYCTYITLFIDE